MEQTKPALFTLSGNVDRLR